jgi:four helix bundle protein
MGVEEKGRDKPGFARGFRDLRVYQAAFEAAMRIFELSKGWPSEEKFALTGQVRRSSRAVCECIAEAWAKRRYPRHFSSKLTDADSEAAETRSWLDFALRCSYLARRDYEDLDGRYDRISASLVSMITGADEWCGPSFLVREEEPPYGPAPEEDPE